MSLERPDLLELELEQDDQSDESIFSCIDQSEAGITWSRMTVYSRRAPNTKMMQAITQHSIAVRPSA